MSLILILIGIVLIVRLAIFFKNKGKKANSTKAAAVKPRKKFTGWRGQLFTVIIFTKLSTKRFFRDKMALFFGILFPLIFLFVFGGVSKGSNSSVSLNVAVINESHSSFAKQFVSETNHSKLFTVNKSLTTLAKAEDKMNKSQI